MLKSILKIEGIKKLSKTEQQTFLGGYNPCSGYNGPPCYGPVSGCASCAEYHSVPLEYQVCALVHVSCEQTIPF